MEEQIKELTLLLSYLTSWNEVDEFTKEEYRKSWKGYDFSIINKLYEEGYIFQRNKNKYFILEEKGVNKAKELMKKYDIE